MGVIKRAKGKIRFAFKNSKILLEKEPRKNSLIMLHFSYGTMRFKYSTGYYSNYNDWDFDKGRVRNKSHILDRAYVNDFLSNLESSLYKELTRLESEQKAINKSELKKKLDEITNRSIEVKEKEPPKFFEYIDQFCLRKKGKITDVTLRSYKQTKKQLLDFDNTLDFENINFDFYDDFVQFLEDDEKSLNTIGKHIKNLKVFLRSATKDGINKNLIYTHSDFKAPKEQTTAIYLDETELKKMSEYNLSAFPNLERARDIFLIGCYTGQRVSDYNGLTKDHIYNKEGISFFKIKQKKTGKEVLCPITEEIRSILEKPKYNNVPPPKMNEPDINENIKEVGRKVGITETVINSYTKGGKKITDKIPKYKLIGTHTARRSFCTNMYKKGMSIYDIMHFSGHSTEKEFYKYIRIEKEERAINIAKSGYFNI